MLMIQLTITVLCTWSVSNTASGNGEDLVLNLFLCEDGGCHPALKTVYSFSQSFKIIKLVISFDAYNESNKLQHCNSICHDILLYLCPVLDDIKDESYICRVM